MRRVVNLAVFVILACSTLSCSAIKEIANLKNLIFSLDNIAQVELAGVPLDDIRSYSDLGLLDVAKLGRAIVGKDIPLSFNLNIGAENPEDNNVQARLVGLDWTLLLQDKETISGVIDQSLVIPAGTKGTIPLTIELELLSFFDESAKDLVDLALSLTGAGGEPKNVKVRALPSIDTPIGPIKYNSPITIVSKDVG